MEEQQQQQLKLGSSPEKERPLTSSDPSSFSSRFLCQLFQLSFVQYLLKLLQRASIWLGFEFPVETMTNQLHPPQSPPRPGRLARRLRGRLERLLLSVVPTRIQNLLGYLPADWGHFSKPREILEALVNPFSKASKRKRDDVALEEQESWFEVLERDLPEDDSGDSTYEPSDEELDSEEFQSQNDTEVELELEVQGGI